VSRTQQSTGQGCPSVVGCKHLRCSVTDELVQRLHWPWQEAVADVVRLVTEQRLCSTCQS
jgi:hypothetical protein